MKAYIINNKKKFKKQIKEIIIIRRQKKKGYELQIKKMIKEYLIMLTISTLNQDHVTKDHADG